MGRRGGGVGWVVPLRVLGLGSSPFSLLCAALHPLAQPQPQPQPSGPVSREQVCACCRSGGTGRRREEGACEGRGLGRESWGGGPPHPNPHPLSHRHADTPNISTPTPTLTLTTAWARLQPAELPLTHTLLPLPPTQVRVLDDFKRLRDPARSRAEYVEQVRACASLRVCVSACVSVRGSAGCTATAQPGRSERQGWLLQAEGAGFEGTWA